MRSRLNKSSLLSEISHVKGLLSRVSSSDILSRMSLEDRINDLEAQVPQEGVLERQPVSVSIFFDGGPVRKTFAIDARFASEALFRYQHLISLQVAAHDMGELPQRGRLPIASEDFARLNVVGVMHGSFGFVLEEEQSEQGVLVESSLEASIGKVNALISAAGGSNASEFDLELQDTDPRVYSSLRSFIKMLHKAKSTIRIADKDRDFKLSEGAVTIANERAAITKVVEEKFEVTGQLLGIAPIQRRFDMQLSGSGEFLSGRVSRVISEDDLQQLAREVLPVGQEWRASISRKLVLHREAVPQVGQVQLIALTRS